MALAQAQHPAMAWVWRRCKVTGLAVDLAAERLVMVNAVTSVVYLAIGGVMALLIALTRWDTVHLLPADWYYRLVGAHGAAMLIFWILFFEVAALIFGSSILLNSRLVAPTLAWAYYALMLIGSLTVLITMLSGQATVMFTAYPPLQAETSLFYLGLLLFAVGALIAVIHYIVNIVGARMRGDVGTLPLFSYALLAASIIAMFTLLSGTAAILPTWLWSIGLVDTVDPGVYRLLFWGFGHGAQQVNLAAMVGVWYALASITTGAAPLNEGVSRIAFMLYIPFINIGAIHHIMVDPGLGNWTRNINTSYLVYAAVLGSMIHAFTIPASIEVAQRRRGFARGLFTWLKKAPWKEPGFSSLVLSFWLFGVMGGISGVIMGGVQTNMIQHNTLISPAHFHMTVVAGTSLAFMGISYYLVPLIFRREHILPRLARIQPYIFALGMTMWGLGMGFAGHAGVSRRHWDLDFGGAPLATDIFDNTQVEVSLLFLGLGAIIAVTGGAIFVLNTAGTVFLGRRSDTPDLGRVAPEAFGLAEGGESERETSHHGRFEAPGTLALAFGFLLLFVILYAISWYELSSVRWLIN